MRPALAPTTGGRRKTSREWLAVSPSGGVRLEEAGKQSIMARTGLPARDLRVLDPLLSYPSSILGRERAIVVNLEHIKAVITATEVLIPNAKGPGVNGFVRDLCARVAPDAMAAEFNDIDVEAAMMNRSLWATSPLDQSAGRDASDAARRAENVNGMHQSSSTSALDTMRDGANVLAFEFRALEVCLESTCRCLEAETLTLEKEAYPALDELTKKISTLNLERVRQIKSRLVAISGRVQKVRDELEHLLDDEMDMAEMYLTEKLNQQRASETESRVGVDPESQDDADDEYQSEADRSDGSFIGFKPNVEELEMLLEAYFVQIDGTLNKLSHLREYVDDTEDYINIMLDDKQNQLLQMGVMLSTATIVITAGVAVVGVFGMNINISLYDDPPDPAAFGANGRFIATSLGTVVACVILYIFAIGFGKRSGLLQ